MAQERNTMKTLWTSTYQNRDGIPDAVSMEKFVSERKSDALPSNPDPERVKAFKTQVKDSLFAVTVG